MHRWRAIYKFDDYVHEGQVQGAIRETKVDIYHTPLPPPNMIWGS